MKKMLFLCLLAGSGLTKVCAQPTEYDDLLMLYADERFEKLLKVATKYTKGDATKKDPLPYLYLAKSYFAMANDPDWAERYPKAYNSAIRYAGNTIRKDKAGTVYEEHIKFFTNLKRTVVTDLEALVEDGAYARLTGAIAKLHRFSRDDVGSYFLKAAAQYQEKDKSGARATQKEAWERLKAVENTTDWRPIDKRMLRLGVMEYCNAQINLTRQVQQAKDVLNKVKPWLEEDEVFMAYYTKVM